MFDCNLIFSSHRVNKLYMQSGAVTDRKGGADLHQHWVSRSCSRVKLLVRCRKVIPVQKELCASEVGHTEGGSLHTNCFLKGIFACSACEAQEVDIE